MKNGHQDSASGQEVEMFSRRGCAWTLSLLFSCASIAAAQDAAPPTRPYDGIQAGLDAFRLAEEKRQGAASQQLFLNDQLKYWSGIPTSRGETIYYGYASPAAFPAYGFGAPVMPGYIYGYPYYPFVPFRQSIGQQQVQTGPNRWESHPIYDPPLTEYRPTPPVDSPLLDRTPYATPQAAAAEQPPPPVPSPPSPPPRRGKEY